MLERAVRSALATSPGTPVLVIDQSEAPTLPEAVRAAIHAGLVEYHRDERVGASRARNLALHLACTDAVVFVDDDCELDPGAVDALLAALTQADDIAITFGSVTAAWPTGLDGFIPGYVPSTPAVLRGRLAKLRDRGIGACMVVRREMAIAAGGFDERLGPGTPLASCEEGEFAYRVLRAGYAIAHAPAAHVRHYGYRAAVEGPHYAFETYRGIGASFALHLRRGDPVAALLLAQQLGIVFHEMARMSIRYRRLGGVSRLRGLLAGIRAGFAL